MYQVTLVFTGEFKLTSTAVVSANLQNFVVGDKQDNHCASDTVEYMRIGGFLFCPSINGGKQKRSFGLQIYRRRQLLGERNVKPEKIEGPNIIALESRMNQITG